MTESTSPFHPGERDIQARLGIEDKMLEPGRRMIRSTMPEQHKEFYAQLPMFFIGGADGDNRIWASAVTGEPGFVSATSDTVLSIKARQVPGDPLSDSLTSGADIGGLGLQLETRRRNRINGRIANPTRSGFDIAVRQSFGNCPKYIQTRTCQPTDTLTAAPQAHTGAALGAAEAGMIAGADTFFIASRFHDETDAAFNGFDVSHRGGQPGFVIVSHSKQLLFPDYAGNRMFNTLGNIQTDPHCGLLFIDFNSGTTLQLTGNAEILWDDAHTKRFPGAQRVIVFSIDAMVRIDNALPLHWQFGEASPVFSMPGFEMPVAPPPPQGSMRLKTISIAMPQDVDGPKGRNLATGIFKQPVDGKIMLSRMGLQGDGQADLRNHGGSFRAVYVYDTSHYEHWAQALERDDFAPGQFGENFTVAGMTESDIHIGDRFRIGDALVEVSQPRVPCFKLTLKMGADGFHEQFLNSNRCGFYLRVIEEGFVTAGDAIMPVHRDPDSLSVARVNALLFHDKGNLEGARRALDIPALSLGWKESFQAQLDKADPAGS